MNATASTLSHALEPARTDGSAGRSVPVRQHGRGRLLPVFTLVLWLGCSLVGVLGFALAYPRPQPPAPEAESIKAEFLHVELEAAPVLPEILSEPYVPLPAPEPPTPIAAPQIAMPVLVAEPSPAIEFALPVEAPAVVVDDARHASYSQPRIDEVAPAAAASAPAMQTLSLGHGEGRQPAPDYPLQARRQRQEGAIKVHFAVGPDGRVLTAEAVEPSPWPLLNESALRTVRQRWRFSQGQPRLYEVLIRFQLDKSAFGSE